jgi:RNA polymerase sporulation-specific sigma factor
VLDQYLKELQKITLLQPQEERALWISYKDDGCAESRGRLIEQYQPLVFREVMRWNMGSDMAQDALQEGTVGLIEAVERYDYKRNIAFPLFAVHRIRGRIIDYLNREGKSGMVSMDEPDANGVALRDTIPDGTDDIAERTERKIIFERVEQALQQLPEKEQLVLESVYLQDKQQKHIAQDMDLSLTYVYRLQKRGIRRVRGMLSRFMHELKESK